MLQTIGLLCHGSPSEKIAKILISHFVLVEQLLLLLWLLLSSPSSHFNMLFKCSIILWSLLIGAIPLSLAFYPSFSRRQLGGANVLSRHDVSSVLFASGEKKNLSASSKEKRQEEKRRLERKTDVVIGKTSAKPEAQDLPLNPKSTEEEWMRQASRIEQKVYKETERGMQCLKMVCLVYSFSLVEFVLVVF